MMMLHDTRADARVYARARVFCVCVYIISICACVLECIYCICVCTFGHRCACVLHYVYGIFALACIVLL